jgi:GTPase SAR1 family protein
METKKNIDIVFTGTLSNGKSTLINSLIGEDLLPVSMGATTSSLMFISKGDNRVEYNDKVVELSKENLKIANQEAEIVNVYIQTFPFENVVFVDSPGIDDIVESREEKSFKYVPNADAVVLVIDISQGMKKSEKEFFDNFILKTNKDKIFVVLNKLDMIMNEEDISIDIDKLKIEGVEKENQFALSAKYALKGVLKNDKELIEKSQIVPFKNHFSNYINTREKYKVFKKRKQHLLKDIERLVNVVLTQTAKDIKKTQEELKADREKLENEFKVLEAKKVKLEENLNKTIAELENCVNGVLNEFSLKSQALISQNVTNQEELVAIFNSQITTLAKEIKPNITKCFTNQNVDIDIDISKIDDWVVVIATTIDDKIGMLIEIISKMPMLEKLKPFKPVAEQFIRSIVDNMFDLEKRVNQNLEEIKQNLKNETSKLLEEEKKRVLQEFENAELGEVRLKIEVANTLIKKRENKIEVTEKELKELQTEYKEIVKLLRAESV